MIRIIYNDIQKEILNVNGKSILELVRESFECFFSPCSKTGKCGRCTCEIIRNNINIGFHLACKVVPEDGDYIVCRFREEYSGGGVSILSDVDDSYRTSRAIAVDLGTTTIAMSYMGKSYSAMNPQRVYGSDVISRIAEASNGHLLEQNALIRKALVDGFKKIDLEHEAEYVVVSGNTTMIHLLMAYDVSGLGQYPFTPISLGMEEFELGGYRVVTMPGISAFVGGDILSGLLYVESIQQEYSHNNYLLVDLGTNGELVLKHNDIFYCSSTSAGPAFEGDATANLPGTDVIHMVAQALRNKAMDETGLLKDDFFELGYPVLLGAAKGEFRLTQNLIRDIQLAKAAVYSGIIMLMNQAKVSMDEIDDIYIAGGFGYYLDTEDAKMIGLLPYNEHQSIVAIGNASLKGSALCAGESGYKEMIKLADGLKDRCRLVDLASSDNFRQMYLNAINFQALDETDMI